MSLQAWLDMRSVIKNLGLKWFVRLSQYAAAMIFLPVLMLTFALLYYFEYHQIDLSWGMWAFIIGFSCSMLVIFMPTFFAATMLNEETEKQIALFNEIRQQLFRMKQNMQVYIDLVEKKQE